jgi:mono/diheme cytochrome c family protein
MLRKMWLLVGTLLVAFGMVTSVAYADAGDPVRGQQLWVEAKLCKSCHGLHGEGSYAGPRAGDGKSLTDWVKQVRTPRANMPSFNDMQVSDQEIADMWEYMQTLSKPSGFTPIVYTPAPGDSPGLVLTHQKRCVACHGDFSAVLKFRFVAQNRTTIDTATVIKQLRTPAKNMPSFSAAQVTDEQAADIAAYLQVRLNEVSASSPAPTTLPVTGNEWPASPWPLVLLIAGISMIMTGLVVRTRRKI